MHQLSPEILWIWLSQNLDIVNRIIYSLWPVHPGTNPLQASLCISISPMYREILSLKTTGGIDCFPKISSDFSTVQWNNFQLEQVLKILYTSLRTKLFYTVLELMHKNSFSRVVLVFSGWKFSSNTSSHWIILRSFTLSGQNKKVVWNSKPTISISQNIEMTNLSVWLILTVW